MSVESSIYGEVATARPRTIRVTMEIPAVPSEETLTVRERDASPNMSWPRPGEQALWGPGQSFKGD
jgi:hypothetical protein